MVLVEVLQAVSVEIALDFCSSSSSSHVEVDWAKVADPVQAYVASLARIGWRAVTATEVEDHKGCRWSFLSLCPEAIAKFVAQATARWSDFNALQKQFGRASAAWTAPTFWEPLRRLKVALKQRHALRSLMCGPTWIVRRSDV